MTRSTANQRGMALIEVLIASAILGIGLVGATQLTLKTLVSGRESRQHAIAQQLAQEAMNCLHAQVKTSTPLCPTQEVLEVNGVNYTRQTSQIPRGEGQLSDLSVRVQWLAPGPRTPASAQTTSTSPAQAQIEWHSSAATLPSWIGVSSP